MLKKRNKKWFWFSISNTTTSIISNPNITKTGTTGNITPSEVTEISLATTPLLIPDITIPLQIPTKTFRSFLDNYNNPKTFKTFAPQDNFSAAFSHQFPIQDKSTANLPFSQFNGTKRRIPKYIPFTDYSNQIQRNSTVTNQSIR